MNEKASKDHLQRLVDEALLSGREDSIQNLFSRVASRANASGVEFDGSAVLEYFWGLARIGAVAVPGGGLGGVMTFKMPQVLLTARGRQLLEKGEWSPHNPSKYLANVRGRVAKPDDIALSYLSEAVEAWRCGLNRSSAVMLGCACERLVLLLAEAISTDKTLPGIQKVDKALDGRVFISVLFEAIRLTLATLKADKRLPKELAEALDRKLSAIFDHARGLRNQTGHPTDEQVSADDAEAGLLLFPGFCELVDRIVTELSKTGTSAEGDTNA